MSTLRNRKQSNFKIQEAIGENNYEEDLNKEHNDDDRKIHIWEAEFLRRKNVKSEFDCNGLYHGAFPERRKIFGLVLISEKDKDEFFKHKHKFTRNKKTKMIYLYEKVVNQLEVRCHSLSSGNQWKIDVEYQFPSFEDVGLLIDDNE